MRRRWIAGTRLAALVGALLTALLLSGCLSVPSSGPVKEFPAGGGTTDREAFPLNPRPPRPGEARSEVVSGFLEAMLATPISTTVAKKYLASEYAGAWDPSRRIITYAARRAPQGQTSTTVALTGANWLDDRGAWQGALSTADSTLHFSLAREDGEWRITQAPDALIVPNWWFQTRFAQRAVYFFDPTGRFLVPEPVFAPNGSQLATTLVSSLLLGPAPENRMVDRTFLPAGTEGLSVPVIDHTAQINITGNTGTQSAHTLQLMAAQLAWTLRQDPTVRELRLTIDGAPVKFPDSGTTFSTSSGMQYDPNGFAAGTDLYSVRRGSIESRSDGQPFNRVGGAWSGTYSIAALAVDPTENHAAAVTADHHEVLVGPLIGRGSVTEAPINGHRLLRPSWDLAGRLWVIDETAAGAAVSYLAPEGSTGVGGAFVPLNVPGVTGQTVRRFLVSRDGTRLVAVIRGPDSDRVVVSRLRANVAGVVVSASRARRIPYPAQGTVRIRDLAWRSPTTVTTVQQLPDDAIVNVLSLDGATAVVPTASRSLVNVVDELVGSPVSGSTLYARSGRTLLDVSGNGGNGGNGDIALAEGTQTVVYAG